MKIQCFQFPHGISCNENLAGVISNFQKGKYVKMLLQLSDLLTTQIRLFKFLKHFITIVSGKIA